MTTLSACGYSYKEDGLYAEIHTNKGVMVAKLFFDKAPVTVGSFVGLAEGTKEFTDPKSGEKVKRPFYNNLIFHRIIKDFMIQGGCPMGNGRGNPGYSFMDEFVPGLVHNSKGILSMANSGPDSNGSQFFITLVPTPHLDNRHTVFGKIVSGDDVLAEIGNVKTDRNDKPVDDVVIKEIKIVRIGNEAKAFNAELAFAKSEEVASQRAAQENLQLGETLKKLGCDVDQLEKTPSGLRYHVIKKGSGKVPAAGRVIVAHYTGYLADGTKFDSSVDRKQPFETQIGVHRVIQGWDETFLTMAVGEKRILVIPFNLAYGERGMPPVIPPRATLVFVVELLDVK